MQVQVAVIATLVATLVGCGGGSATTSPPKAFDIDGSWLYLGPSDVPHDLTITDKSMVYTDVDGQWSSKWTIKTYDDDQHHFQVTLDSGSGTYLPVGQSMSGTYDVSGTLLTTQLANGLSSYPQLQYPGTCTGGTDGTAAPDCRLYVHQN